MQAAFYERTGAARSVLCIADLPLPQPAAGEVRVKLATSGVNPSDVKLRAGLRGGALPWPRIVPHSDGAGVIDAVGAGVPPSRIGERVWVWNACWGRPHGTAAEYVALPSRQAVPLPPDVGFAAGACFGIPALTAWHAVHMDGGCAGRQVLVTGAAGAVGHYAVQFAKAAGARVIATVSSEEKAAIARAAGADEVLFYRREDVAARALALTDGVGVDRVIEVDLATNLPAALAALRAEGDVVAYGSGAPEIAVPFLPSVLKNVRYRFFIVYHLTPADRARAVAGLTRALEAGTLTHHLGPSFALADIAAAHEAVEAGALGKVVVTL
ncbi:MAG TPA: NADPH:quinone reductase [Gammaproteobacteria bacterium]|nr:NADPH:quinone reductase [Gammaproteobacteria bacterium]